MRGGGGGEGGLGTSRSSPELVLSVSIAVGDRRRKIREIYIQSD